MPLQLQPKYLALFVVEIARSNATGLNESEPCCRRRVDCLNSAGAPHMLRSLRGAAHEAPPARFRAYAGRSRAYLAAQGTAQGRWAGPVFRAGAQGGNSAQQTPKTGPGSRPEQAPRPHAARLPARPFCSF